MGARCTIDLNQLLIGSALTQPINDTRGVLLLAAGMPFTPEVKERLLQRGVLEVSISTDDLECTTLDVELAQSDDELARLEESLVERLDGLIGDGVMQVRNDGPPVLRQAIKHGRKAYDAGHKERLSQTNNQACVVLEDVAMAARGKGEIDATKMFTLAGRYVESLTSDLESTLCNNCGVKNNLTDFEHVIQVATLSMAVAIDMGLDMKHVCTVGFAGLVHDLGMVGVPERIREAERPLTDVEFVEIQKYPILTANLLEKCPQVPSIVRLVAYQVHERLDGSGYPRARDKRSIHPFARILGLSDAYVALVAERPYRKPFMPYAAMEILLRETAQGRFDHSVMRSLLNVQSLFPIGSFVLLTDQSIAMVLRANGTSYMSPIVARLRDGERNKIDRDSDEVIVDLTQSDLSVVQALPTPGRNEVGIEFELERLQQSAARAEQIAGSAPRRSRTQAVFC
jgi:HD-GYP domain-containing protein (c-di-GMP phosphodiesterase class II)